MCGYVVHGTGRVEFCYVGRVGMRMVMEDRGKEGGEEKGRVEKDRLAVSQGSH